MEEESLYADLLAALPFPLIVLDGRDRFVWLNPLGEDFFQLSLPVIKDLALDQLIDADSHVFSLIRHARHSGHAVAENALRFSGPKLPTSALVHVQIAPFIFKSASYLLMVMHKKTLADHLAPQNQFKGAALSLAGMTALLAHEIKNPLAGIKGAAQLLEMEGQEMDDQKMDSQEIDKHARSDLCSMITAEVDRITALLGRLEIMGAPVHFTDVNIHQILDHCVQVTKASFGQHLQIHTIYDPSLPAIEASRDGLIQCFLNLCKNAAEATGPGDQLEITTSYALSAYGGHLPLQIDICDSGKGIEDALEPHIFEPFISNKSGGSGLGLALVASVVADHGGVVTIQPSHNSNFSPPNFNVQKSGASKLKGAHFRLNFPLKSKSIS